MKRTPALTHTEILCLAIKYLESEIQSVVEDTKHTVSLGIENDYAQWIKNMNEPKIEALKKLYQIETGTEY